MFLDTGGGSRCGGAGGVCEFEDVVSGVWDRGCGGAAVAAGDAKRGAGRGWISGGRVGRWVAVEGGEGAVAMQVDGGVCAGGDGRGVAWGDGADVGIRFGTRSASVHWLVSISILPALSK